MPWSSTVCANSGTRPFGVASTGARGQTHSGFAGVSGSTVISYVSSPASFSRPSSVTSRSRYRRLFVASNAKPKVAPVRVSAAGASATTASARASGTSDSKVTATFVPSGTVTVPPSNRRTGSPR